jgi:hypothetical protein
MINLAPVGFLGVPLKLQNDFKAEEKTKET